MGTPQDAFGELLGLVQQAQARAEVLDQALMHGGDEDEDDREVGARAIHHRFPG